MMTTIVPVILSGGSGTRLWPLSRPEHPKQFHDFGDGRTLLQETVARLSGEAAGLTFAPPIVIGNVAHEDAIATQLTDIGLPPAAVILEPMGRNTAAAALLAAEAVADTAPNALALLAPADHRILEPAAFHAAIARAAATAHDRIVTFGITPRGPETGYGYIERGAGLADGVFEIARFREKPKRDVAEEIWQDGRHAWNAGIFLFAPQTVKDEFAAAPEIRDATLAAWRKAERSGCTVRLQETDFARVPSAPFDIAIMEKTRRSAVAPCDFGWADLGAWDEVWRTSGKDKHGNAHSGAAVLQDARDCLVIGEGIPVAVCGVEGLVVVATTKGVLVLPKERAQDVKTLVEKLNASAGLK